MAGNTMNPLTRTIVMARHAWAVFRAKETPRHVKLILGLGLAYILSPWDIVPEWLPVIGMMDDLALAALLISWASGFDVSKDE